MTSSMKADRVELGLGMLSDLQLNRPSDKELRILIFTATYFVLDGVTLTIRRLESHLRSRGAIVKICSTVPDNLLQDSNQGPSGSNTSSSGSSSSSHMKDIIVVPGIKIPFNHAGEYSFGVGLDDNTLAQIEEFKPNVVHFTVPDFVGLDGVRWCQKNNIPYIGTWHSNYCDYLKYYFLEWILGPGLNKYLKGFFEQIPTVYVPTPYMLKKMREEWGYGTTTELKEWGRGVDMNIFSPDRRSQAFRSSKGISENDIVVLWVSRIVPEKRPDIWLAVVKRLQDEGLPIKPLVVGSGTFEKYLSKLKHVTCCGWLSGTALGEAYASSDVLLFPSDVETFGNVTLEALASGCPSVVETKCGEHLVEHGVNGLTCAAGDFEAFYQATRSIVLDARLRHQMSAAARAGAWKYERNVILQQMAENYKDAIVKHRDPAFLKRHMQSAEGAGRNLLSVLCCNYYFIKMGAEPFLNTSRGVQDFVDNTADCVQGSRNRIGCTDFMSTANLNTLTNDDDIESARLLSGDDDQSKKSRRFTAVTSYASSCCATLTAVCTSRAVSYCTTALSVVIVFMFIYASFTV